MNWGHKITLVIIIFIVSMVAMVFVAFNQTNEMIDENYYEKELKYQSLIDASRNLSLVYDSNIVFQNAKTLIVKIPKSLFNDFGKGKIEFIKNDNKKQDLTINFRPNTSGLFIINKTKMFFGSYKVRIRWENNQKLYYKEQTILIEK